MHHFPICIVTVDGIGVYDAVFMHCLAERSSSCWNKSFGEVFGWPWIKAILSFTMIMATHLYRDHV